MKSTKGYPQDLDPRSIKGIGYFNQKRFFDAHEELELAWRDETGEIRNLYRGILQIGVAFHHIQKQNYIGAKKLFYRARKWLAPYSGIVSGINISKLKDDAEKIAQMVENKEFERLQMDGGRIFPIIETTFLI